MSKKSRSQTYYQYLVKWEGQLVEDTSWMIAVELHKFGVDFKALQDQFSSPGV